jgi:2'-5' RNA ligase
VSGSARLFIAIDPPAPVRGELFAWTRAATRAARAQAPERGVRVLDPELVHLTLCFVGNRPATEIEPLVAALEAFSPPPLEELSTGAPLWLPPRRPRALAVEVHDDGGRLAALRAALAREVLAVCGVELERQRFRPHLTVARLRQGAAPRERRLDPTPALAFTPAEVVLYRSWLSAQGPTYEAMARRALEAA